MIFLLDKINVSPYGIMQLVRICKNSSEGSVYMRTNYHTHHQLCGHAYGTAEMYVKEAIKNDVVVLGFSDHSPSDSPFDKGYRMTSSQLDFYIEDVLKAKQKYKNQIEIHVGLELEYIENNEAYYDALKNKVEYFILGQHFVTMKETGKQISSYEYSRPSELYRYSEMIQEGLQKLPITILAHPDLYLFHYRDWDIHCEKVAREICEAAKQTNTYIEYNANGFRREQVETKYGTVHPYPRQEFFEIVKEYQIPVVISSDCHHPSDVYDDTMVNAVKKAKQMGLNVVDSIQLKSLK